MLTTREAARLLTEAATGADGAAPGALAALTAAMGFGEPLRVGRSARRRLGLEDDAASAHVAAPPGQEGGEGLRALLLTLHPGASVRERVGRLARSVARESRSNLWLIVARDASQGALVVAAPAPGGGGGTAAMGCDAGGVLASDAESFAALAAHRADTSESALLVHLRWRETLGRDALSRRFYRELEGCVGRLAVTAIGDGRAGMRERRTLALLQASRLLFLAFLEAKGWLDGDRSFLRRRFEAACGGRGVHQRLLLPLCFGTLNTPPSRRAAAARALGRVPFLNGGLFTRTPLERRHRALRFTDDALGDVIGGLLGRYRLTARETSVDWSDAAVDPEMLGRAFESLMHADDRRAAGAFYTPHALIVRLTRSALDALPGLEGPGALARLDALRVLDPACGSGAFLVHVLEALADRRGALGDERPLGARRRHVLTRSIFGVDIDPTAVWLCQLRLWLSVVVDDDASDALALLPLPNLDRNVREGDALAGEGFGDARESPAPTRPGGVTGTLRLRYSRASGARKRTLARALDHAERSEAIAAEVRAIARLAAQRRELLTAVRAPDLFRARRGPDAAQRRALEALRTESRARRAALRRLREGGALPFAFGTHFPDVATGGGFSLVIGNPPWVRPHDMATGTLERDALRARFVTLRRAAWEAGAEAAGAGRGFASQADLAALFTERAVALAQENGIVALLLPSKLWVALAGGGVRTLLAERAPVRSLEDWSDAASGFDAVVYPSAMVARRGGAGVAPVMVTLHRRGRSVAWRTDRARLALDASDGAPWLLLPPAAREAHAALERAGTPLAQSIFGRPMLGVKSGCNEAFVVRRVDEARVRSGDREALLDPSSLRPVLRGEHLQPWRRSDDAAREAIVWTHDAVGAPVATLPAATGRWLQHWRRRLESRTDARQRGRWWSLFRTEAASAHRPRVVWGDIGRTPRALVLAAGDPTVPLNSCYVVRAPSLDDAHALAALLNSSVALAWLGALAEPARGGYHRFLGWTCARLPLPAHWERARDVLAPLGRAAAEGDDPGATLLTACALEAYAIDRTLLEPLLDWSLHERA